MNGKEIRYIAHIYSYVTEVYDDQGFVTRTQCDAWWMCQRETYRRMHKVVRWNKERKMYEVLDGRGQLLIDVQIYAC